MKPSLAILTKSDAGEELSLGNYSCQLAATIINPHYKAHVFQVEPAMNVDFLIESIEKELPNPVFGFSTIRHEHFADFVKLASELRKRGYIAFLAGPTSHQRYVPEVDHEKHEHRFHGNLDNFNFCIKGPAEQAIEVLYRIENNMDYSSCPGVSTVRDGKAIINTQSGANSDLLAEVDWSNIHDFEGSRDVEIGNVLAQWGCPYGKRNDVLIDPPFGIEAKKYKLRAEACTFCSYSYDVPKVYTLPLDNIKHQISNLKKFGIRDFFLIHQNPFQILPEILDSKIERIRLMSRADLISKKSKTIEDVVKKAENKGVILDVFCVGFESFTERILSYFNKGTTVADNFNAAEVLLYLEDKYKSLEITPGPHGLIFPTPWHSTDELWHEASLLNRDQRITPFFMSYIFERHLRISHADPLAEWIRFIEQDIKYKRDEGGIIHWHTEATKLWPGFPYGDSVRLDEFKVGIRIPQKYIDSVIL